MALRKAIEIGNSGLVAEYWRLTHWQVDQDAAVVEFRLHGYPNQAARKAGKAPLPVLSYALPLDILPSRQSIAVQDLYAAARGAKAIDGQAWLDAAEDC